MQRIAEAEEKEEEPRDLQQMDPAKIEERINKTNEILKDKN